MGYFFRSHRNYILNVRQISVSQHDEPVISKNDKRSVRSACKPLTLRFLSDMCRDVPPLAINEARRQDCSQIVHL
ncbi:hypothetical protein P9578_27115 [Brevibacillus choshinensis]|uniref:hypothetical protein n=1 Tax=Brevibacillus choshinensis TaxID=54911 RepID=UPI002E1F2FA9|nr:hypothetical protein [Brevibacillus choshinensis]